MAYTESTVGQLVAEKPGRARVFERYGIDYCCGGRKPLAVACQEKGLDVSTVVVDLERADSSIAPRERDWTKAPMADLCTNIEQTHHAYLREELPRLEYLTGKVANRHGSGDGRLVQLHDLFVAFKGELEQHMEKEERILFPMIRDLEANGTTDFHCGSLENPIRVMFMEHDNAGAALERMRALTDGFVPPAEACNSYRSMLDGLAAIEADMHTHVHKENNILFPRAVEAEAKARR